MYLLWHFVTGKCLHRLLSKPTRYTRQKRKKQDLGGPSRNLAGLPYSLKKNGVN